MVFGFLFRRCWRSAVISAEDEWPEARYRIAPIETCYRRGCPLPAADFQAACVPHAAEERLAAYVSHAAERRPWIWSAADDKRAVHRRLRMPIIGPAYNQSLIAR